MTETLLRQWAMLKAIPRYPARTTAADIEAALRENGYVASRRTIERDLQTLSSLFPLAVADSSKPFGWQWAKGAPTDVLPAFEADQAAALLLAREHLHGLVPTALSAALRPVYAAASRAVMNSGWRDWHKRTAVIPNQYPLLPPEVDDKVLSTVQRAIAEGRRLEGSYRKRGQTEAQDRNIDPLGLIRRGNRLLLVALLDGGDELRHLALHRLSKAKLLDEKRRQPKAFDLAQHLLKDGRLYASRGSIKLVCRFEAKAAEHLLDSRLSTDQRWEPEPDPQWVKVTATVEEDNSLRWWLKSFGALVEVLKPDHLRAEIAADAAAAARHYTQGH